MNHCHQNMPCKNTKNSPMASEILKKGPKEHQEEQLRASLSMEELTKLWKKIISACYVHLHKPRLMLTQNS